MQPDSDTQLTPAEQAELRGIAAIMLPASEEFAVPGADDPLIFADIVGSIGRDLVDLRTALAELAALSGGSFAMLDTARAEQVIQAFCARGDAPAAALSRCVLQCYYRDNRVLHSLGHESRAPFPKGHLIDQGEWALLEAVRDRPPFWRDDRTA